MKTELRGKTAVVTGAAGAMGRAVVAFLQEDGLNVVGLDIRGDCLHCDVRDPRAVHAALVKIGPVDVLVNNAGILSNRKAQATTPDEWHDVLASNVDSAFYFSQEVMPGMRARRITAKRQHPA